MFLINDSCRHAVTHDTRACAVWNSLFPNGNFERSRETSRMAKISFEGRMTGIHRTLPTEYATGPTPFGNL